MIRCSGNFLQFFIKFIFVEKYLFVAVLVYLGNMFNDKKNRRICDMNFSEIFPYVFWLLIGVCSWRDLI